MTTCQLYVQCLKEISNVLKQIQLYIRLTRILKKSVMATHFRWPGHNKILKSLQNLL